METRSLKHGVMFPFKMAFKNSIPPKQKKKKKEQIFTAGNYISSNFINFFL